MSLQFQENPNFKTWAKALDAAFASGGKTKGTFDKAGTITFPNKSEDLYLYGILIGVGLEIATAGQGLGIAVEFNSSDLGLYKEQFILKSGTNDAIATNNKAVYAKSEFLPIQVDGKVNGKALDVHFSNLATTTGDLTGHVSAIFGNLPVEQLPLAYLLELMGGYESKVRALARLTADAAKAHGTADADVALTGIEVPSSAKQLVGLTGALVENAETASEELLSMFSFESGDVSDFAPQEYPACVNTLSPALGTPVGAPALIEPRYYPVRFPLPGKKFTMIVKSRSAIAITNAPNTFQGIKYRV